MEGRGLAVILVAISTVLAVRALLDPTEPVPRVSAVPRVVEWAARLPAPGWMAARARVPEPLVAAAGWQGDIDAVELGRARASGLLAGAAIGVATAVAVQPALVVLAPLLGAVGWWLPVRLAARHGWARRGRMARQLPDLLDVLGLCAETGMAADPALRAASGRLRGPLAAEVRHAIEDIDLGASRARAYGDLADRVGLDEMHRVIGALVDADDLGAPLAQTLRHQSRRTREDARRAAHAAASKAGPKIQLVIALLMVPAALLMVLAVMGTEMVRQVAPVFGAFG